MFIRFITDDGNIACYWFSNTHYWIIDKTTRHVIAVDHKNYSNSLYIFGHHFDKSYRVNYNQDNPIILQDLTSLWRRWYGH